MSHYTLLVGDARCRLAEVPAGSVQCCVTSPPYWNLRDYDHEGQVGLETSVDEYVKSLVDIFRHVREALQDAGTLWLNLGDCYAGARGGAQGKNGRFAGRSIAGRSIAGARERSTTTVVDGLKPKDLVGVPWRVAFALQADGWWLRQAIIWHKPNAMPESVKDRCTKSHETVFLLSKSADYFFDIEANQEPAACPEGPGNKDFTGREALEAGDESFRTRTGFASIGPRNTRNRRDVWTLPTQPSAVEHFATMPPNLARRCVLLGSRGGGARA